MDFDAKRGEYVISTDRAQMNISVIHGFLTRAYWCEGIPESTVRRAIENSLCFGVFCSDQQVGFARVVTDRATYAYLADVFVLEGFRGRGLAKWLMEAISAHPDLQGLRRWMFATRDAHELYRGYGFTSLAVPERFMERHDADVYHRGIGRDWMSQVPVVGAETQATISELIAYMTELNWRMWDQLVQSCSVDPAVQESS